MMMAFMIALVAVSAAGFLAGYLVAIEQDRRVWLPVVEAAAARPVHVIVEHTGPQPPADPAPDDMGEDDTPEPEHWKWRAPR